VNYINVTKRTSPYIDCDNIYRQTLNSVSVTMQPKVFVTGRCAEMLKTLKHVDLLIEIKWTGVQLNGLT